MLYFGAMIMQYRMAATEQEVELYLTNKGVSRECWKRVADLSIAAFGAPDPAPSLSLGGNAGGDRLETGEEEGKDGNENPFPEAAVDDMRAAREVALNRYVAEAERRRDLAAKLHARSGGNG